MNTYDYIINKYKITVGRQYIIEIPKMDSIDLAHLFGELNLTKGAEIGVYWGEYSEILCRENPKLELKSIDPYLASAYYKGQGVNEQQEYFDNLYERAKTKLAPYNCTIVRKTSAEALNDFEDNSLDFVYIDANHDFPNFVFDLHNWLKKVKVGGIISGHDYVYMSYRRFHHVKRALIAYARSYRMIPLFICGDTDQGTKLKRDHFRSWFWVKT